MTAVNEEEADSSLMGVSSNWRRMGNEFMMDSEEQNSSDEQMYEKRKEGGMQEPLYFMMSICYTLFEIILK